MAKVRKTGGWQQRLTKAQRADVDIGRRCEPALSEFAMGEVHDWAFGDTSAPQLRRKMKNHCADALQMNNTIHTDVTRLYRAGGQGARASPNTHRSLMTFCRKQFQVDDLVVPVAGASLKFILPPHKMIHRLAQLNLEHVTKSLGCNAEVVFRFWDMPRCSSPDGAEMWQSHAFLKHATPRDLMHTVPMSLHEDSGPYSKKQSVDCISVASLLGSGAELDTKI